MNDRFPEFDANKPYCEYLFTDGKEVFMASIGICQLNPIKLHIFRYRSNRYGWDSYTSNDVTHWMPVERLLNEFHS